MKKNNLKVFLYSALLLSGLSVSFAFSASQVDAEGAAEPTVTENTVEYEPVAISKENFPDDNLRTILKSIALEMTNHGSDGNEFTSDMLKNLGVLRLNDTGVVNLKGLELLPELVEVRLTGSAVNDLAPLNNCKKLTNVIADKTQIENTDNFSNSSVT